MSFDINKPYQTRDGRKAWLTRLPKPLTGGQVFVGYIETDTGREIAWWFEGGEWWPSGSHPYDLINIPETRTVKVWINAYEGGTRFYTYASRNLADRFNLGDRESCVEREITYTVGEGLEESRS